MKFFISCLGFDEPKEVQLLKEHRSYVELDTSKIKDGCFINKDSMLFSKKTFLEKGTKKSGLAMVSTSINFKINLATRRRVNENNRTSSKKMRYST